MFEKGELGFGDVVVVGSPVARGRVCASAMRRVAMGHEIGGKKVAGELIDLIACEGWNNERYKRRRCRVRRSRSTAREVGNVVKLRVRCSSELPSSNL